MKILVVCQYYWPIEFQINQICEDLVKRGEDVTVLTGLPNYPLGEVFPEYKHGKNRFEIINGVKVHRSFEIGRGKNIISLGINYLSFMMSASRKVSKLDKDFDVVFVNQQSPVFMAYPGIVAKKKLKIPLFLLCCDLWPESLRNILKSDKSFIFKMIGNISRSIYHKCDRIAVQTEAFKDYFIEEHGISPDKLTFLPAFADETHIEEDYATNNGIIDFVFMGNVGIAQSMPCLVKAVEILQTKVKGFLVHIVGDGNALETTKNLVKEKHLEEFFRFYGHRPKSEMPDYYRIADACLLLLSADSKIGITMPTKLQGYMVSGKPVIAAANGTAQKVINDAECGICVDADDSINLSKAMERFICEFKTLRHYGENGRTYYKEHFRESKVIDSLVSGLNDLIDERG